MLIIAYSLGHLHLPTLRIAFPASRLTPWLVSRSWTSSLRRCRTSQDHVACTELLLLCQISCGHVTSTDPGVDRCRLSLDACVLFCFVGTRGVFGLYSKDEISSYLVQRYIPNCGLGIVLLDIGALLECRPMEGVGTALVIVLSVLWLAINAFHVEALYQGRHLVVD
jgi:hypothetical protein